MGKVKAADLFIDKRAGLLNEGAEHGAKGRLEKVGRRVIAAYRYPLCIVNIGRYLIADLKFTVCNGADMKEDSFALFGIVYVGDGVIPVYGEAV